MQHKYWLGAAAGALAVMSMAVPSQAAPLSAGANEVKAAAADSTALQGVHWYGQRDRGYYYGPRYYRHYGYRDYRPYRYYGYGPSFGFYAGPRYYRRGWW